MKSSLPISFVETPEEIVELMVSLIDVDSNLEQAKILDTGFGRGVFIKQLIKSGFKNIEGIELDEEMYKLIRNSYPSLQLYNQDFLSWEPEEPYDYIIGNPPYAHFNSLPPDFQRKVKSVVGTAESDIYYAFILKSIDLLKEGGSLIYIVPFGFFYNTFAQKVREEIISNGYLDLVIDLDENRLFLGENPETIIFRFRKVFNNQNKETKFIRANQKNLSIRDINRYVKEAITKTQSNTHFSFFTRTSFSLKEKVWSTYPKVEIPSYCLLKEIAWVGVGLVTGFEKAFKLEESDIEKINEAEEGIVLSLVKANNCKSYWIEGHNKYFLLDEAISSEDQIEEKYPHFFSKISKFKSKMNNRYLPNKKKWFNWQALRNFEQFKRYIKYQKIFVPNLDRSKTNRFSLTSEEFLPSGDVLTIIPLKISPFFLLGYLNSDFFRNYYLSAGARRGHRIAYTQRILSNVKIPLFKKEIEEKIAAITKEIFNEKNLIKRSKIETEIEKAFQNNSFRDEI